MAIAVSGEFFHLVGAFALSAAAARFIIRRDRL
jgi:hypothetical protein